MAGILSDSPIGALDPRSAALAQMGFALMGSGPSTTPVSLGSVLGQAGMQGMNAFAQAQQANQQQQLFALKMAEAQREAAERARQEQARASLMRNPEFAKYAPFIEAGVPLSSVLDRAIPKAGARPIVAAPGSILFNEQGKPIANVPFKPEEAKPPMTRKVRIGNDEVTQEYVNGGWQEVGRGPAFAKQVPAVVLGGGAKGVPAPKPPTGFRWKPGSEGEELEPIPGGPKDTSAKDSARAQGAIQKADTVIQKVNEALEQTGFSSTGLTGTLLGAVPGTKAFDLDKTIDTIKANLGFSELQAMREASPTGGALGQVAIQELAMLQSTVASLDKGQSEENLRRGLEQVRTHFENWKKAVQEAQSVGQPAARPQKGQVIDGWEFVGGDPGNRMNWKKAK